MPTIAVSGSRNPMTLHDEQLVRAELMKYFGFTIHVGDCPTGLDSYIRGIWNTKMLQVFEADWTRGKRGGPERNERMLRGVSALIAFPGVNSRGTKNAIDQAIAKGIETHVFPLRNAPRNNVQTEWL